MGRNYQEAVVHEEEAISEGVKWEEKAMREATEHQEANREHYEHKWRKVRSRMRCIREVSWQTESVRLIRRT